MNGTRSESVHHGPRAASAAPRPAATAWAVSVVALLALPAMIAGPAHAQRVEQVPIGPRAIAMGSAYSSLADDATGAFWNPAGLVWIGHQELDFTHANLFNSGIADNYAAFLLPLTPKHAAALDWYHSGFDDNELAFGENRIDFAYGWRAAPFLSLGAASKYLTRSTDLDGVSVRSGYGAGLDFGAIAQPVGGLRLGLMAMDAFNTRLRYSAGGSEVAYPRTLRAAASYGYRHLGTLALDVDDRWHVGAEFTPPLPSLGGAGKDVSIALRGGMEIERYTGEGTTFTAGLGLKVGVLRADYAYVQHPTLDATHHFGVAMDFNFNPALVRIERVKMRDVYTSLYKSYAADTVAQVAVANSSERPLEVSVGLALPGLTDAPSESTLVLRPRATEELALPVVLAPRVMEQRGNRQLQAEVSVKYQSQRLARTERRRSLVTAYGPGAIDWGLGLDQAAAYVTLNDPVVFDLAREAIRAVPPDASSSFGARGLARVAAVFDALQVLHVVYVPDPNSPYSRVRHEAGTVDLVQYPRQTLARRTGDCDDTSTLVAALLGSVGIDTRLVDAPGHLFLLVDTGVHERNRMALSLDERMTAVVDEEVWIPLETTAIDRGFAEAWRQGAELYSSLAARGEASTVDVAEAQARFEPAELSGEASAPALDGAALATRFASDAGTLRGWQAEYASNHYPGAGGRRATSPALLELGHVYFLAGRVDSACASLTLALAAQPNSPCAHNDLAVALTARGDLDAALAHLDAAVAADPSDPGVWLNLGLVRYAAGDTADAVAALEEGVTRGGGYDGACALLSVSGPDELAREGVPRLSREQVRRLLHAAIVRVPQNAGVPVTSRRLPPALPPALQSARTRTRPAAPRSGIEQLQEFLYWKSSGGTSCAR